MNLDWLQSRPEVELHQLMADLLRAMGYQQVTITHGSREVGRDLVFLETDKAMRSIWRGVQVKAIPMSGRFEGESSMRGLLGQLEAALDTPYTSPNGQDVHLQEVWLVNTFQLSESAKQSIQGKLKSQRQIHIIDGPALADLVQHYLPELDRLGSQPIEDYLNNLISLSDSADDYISTRMHIKYSLSDIYVPSRAYIEIIPFGTLSVQPRLTAILGLDDLDQLLFQLKLLQRRAMPLQTWNAFMRVLRRTADLGKRIKFQGWYELREGLLRSIERFCDIIELPRIALFERDFEQFHDSHSSNVDVSLLLRLTRQEKILPIQKQILYGQLSPSDRGKLLETGIRCPESFPGLNLHEHGSYELTESRFFLDDLNQALLANTLPSRDEDNKVSIAEEAFRLINSRVHDFDFTFRRNYEPVWQEFSSYQATEFNFHDKGAVRSLCDINELSSIVIDYYEVTNPEHIEFDAVQLVSSLPRSLCVGNLGMGKTMLLKRVSNLKAKSASKEKGAPIPILCSLSTIKERSNALVPELILQAADKTSKALLQISEHKCNWILDGFDEVYSLDLRRRILDWITSNIDQGPHIILSSRPGAIAETLPGVVKAWLQQFSSDQIRSYIKQFPWSDPTQGEKMTTILFSSDRISLRELAATPILLTMIVLVAVHGGPDRLPKRRDDLYASILRLVMGDWDASRGVFRPQAIEDEGLRWMLLESTAYALYADRKRAFTENEFAQYCVQSPIGKIAKIDESVAMRFTDNLMRDCVLLPLSRKEYGFFHFSIQEYLAAREMSRDIGVERVTKAILEYFRSEDRWWEEVLVFYAGLKRTAAPLIKTLHQHMTTRVYSDHPALRSLLKRWLEVADFTIIESDGASGSVKEALRSMKVL
jgi:hypothetical protein